MNIKIGSKEISTGHSFQWNFAMADGSVRTVDLAMDTIFLGQLSNRRNSEYISVPEEWIQHSSRSICLLNEANHLQPDIKHDSSICSIVNTSLLPCFLCRMRTKSSSNLPCQREGCLWKQRALSARHHRISFSRPHGYCARNHRKGWILHADYLGTWRWSCCGIPSNYHPAIDHHWGSKFQVA